jgi:hypothetical protein
MEVASAEINLRLLDEEYERKKRQISEQIAQWQSGVVVRVNLDNSDVLRRKAEIERSLAEIGTLSERTTLQRRFNAGEFTAPEFKYESLELDKQRSRSRIEQAKQESRAIENELGTLDGYREQVQKKWLAPYIPEDQVQAIARNKDEIYKLKNELADLNRQREQAAQVESEDAKYALPGFFQPIDNLLTGGPEARKRREQELMSPEERQYYGDVDSKTTRELDLDISKAQEKLKILENDIKFRQIQIDQSFVLKEPDRQTTPSASAAEGRLLTRLANARKRIAEEELKVEQSNTQQQKILREETTKIMLSQVEAQAAIYRRGVDEQIVDTQRLATSYKQLERIQKARTDRTEQRLDIRKVDLQITEDFAKVEQREAIEVEQLYKIVIDPESTRLQREEVARQLKELTGVDRFAQLKLPGLDIEDSLLVRRQQEEDVVAKAQQQALTAQLEQKQISLELDQRSVELAQARLEIEQRLALLQAQRNVVAAIETVQKAQVQLNQLPENATEAERTEAQTKVKNAEAQLAIATESVDGIGTGLVEARAAAVEYKALAEEARNALRVQSEATKSLFNLNDAARERKQSLDLADAGVNPARYNRRLEPLQINDRSMIQQRYQPEQSRALQGDNSQWQSMLNQLQDLININKQMSGQNGQMLSELQTIADRPAVNVSVPRTTQPGVLRGTGI